MRKRAPGGSEAPTPQRGFTDCDKTSDKIQTRIVISLCLASIYDCIDNRTCILSPSVPARGRLREPTARTPPRTQNVLERIERQDPGAAAAWRRKYGKPVSWLPERDAGAVTDETAKTEKTLADALAASYS